MLDAATDASKDARVAPPVVSVSNVTHRYGKTLAVDGLSLDIPSGLMVGVIGPDGVGKSTLLALIAGSKKIQQGKVIALGGDMADGRHRRDACPRIAYMPQGLGKNLYLELSVAENIDFMARLFGLSAEERSAKIKELLDATGLGPFPERPAGKLSGGMKQKVSLCGALVHEPDLLILDEPTTGVDPLSRRQFWTLIDDIRKERPGMSVMISTAYMDEAERWDWIVAMDAGRVLATGSPKELMERTGTKDLERCFVQLLPEEKRSGHAELTIPPRAGGKADIVIDAKGLTRRFGDFVAVDHVTLTIERGEIFGFLGSNGCGKSTTMKMLTGLLPPTEGSATLFGHSVEAGSIEVRKNLGYMTQAFSLYRGADGQREPRSRRAPLSYPARQDEGAHRRARREIRSRTLSRRAYQRSAPRPAPAAFARGRRAARAADAHSRRAHLRRRPRRARQLSGTADRSVAQARRDDLRHDAFHERGDALRPHLAHECGESARRRRAAKAHRGARSLFARGGLYRLHGGRDRRKGGPGARRRRDDGERRDAGGSRARRAFCAIAQSWPHARL